MQFRKGRAYLGSQFKATDTHDNRSLRPLVTFHPWSEREREKRRWTLVPGSLSLFYTVQDPILWSRAIYVMMSLHTSINSSYKLHHRYAQRFVSKMIPDPAQSYKPSYHLWQKVGPSHSLGVQTPWSWTSILQYVKTTFCGV